MVADTELESDAEASDVEDYSEDEEGEDKEEQQQKQQLQLQSSAEVEPQPATSGWLPTWGPPQGRNTNIHPSVGPAKGGPWNLFSTFWI